MLTDQWRSQHDTALRRLRSAFIPFRPRAGYTGCGRDGQRQDRRPASPDGAFLPGAGRVGWANPQ